MTKNQKYVVWSLVAVAVVVLLLLGFHRSAPQAPATGLTQADLGQFPEGVKNGDLFERWETATLPAGQASVPIFTNRSGRDVMAFLGSVDVPTGQTASSTSLASIFATTSSSVASTYDFLPPTGLTTFKSFLISQIVIATSTTATTTNSVLSTVQGKGNGFVIVPDGSTLFGYLQQNRAIGNGCFNGAQTGLCESATSSNRGFNPVFNVKVYSPQF